MMLSPSDPMTVSVPSLGFGDYERFSQLLLEHCGLNFSERRRSELELAVRQAFAASTCADLNEYYQLLQDPIAGRIDLDRLINAVTVNETHFFRDAAQFDALYYHVLPQLIERKRPLRTMRIWSAGCASGEEPFSIAMLLRELLPDVDDWAITILGTDINTEALNRARQGIYGDWAFREDRAKLWRLRYFQSRGNRYELAPEVRRMVVFDRLNLAEPVYPAYETNTMMMDLILCRNVTIYFSEIVTQAVVNRFYDGLLDEGWLVVGHSEPSLFTYQRFQAHNFPDTVLYQRTGQPTVLPKAWVCAPPPETASPTLDTVPVESPAVVDDHAETPSLIPAAAMGTQDFVEQAQELLEYGRSEEARDLLLALVDERPAQAAAYALLGQAYANLGQWQEAEHWCLQAVRIDNLHMDAYYTLALVVQHQGELGRAIDALKKVIYIDRNNVLGHFGLADLYHSTGQLPQAFKSLDNARHLLERYADEQIIPGSGGIMVRRLREAVIRQQQQWGAEGARAPAARKGPES